MLELILASCAVGGVLLVIYGILQHRHDTAMTERERIRATRYAGGSTNDNGSGSDTISSLINMVMQNPEILQKLLGKRDE